MPPVPPSDAARRAEASARSSDPLAMFRLDDRTALITGVGPGIGEHVARAFAAVGANVVLAARSADRLERVASAIRGSGGRAVAVPTDVGVPEQREALVAAARSEFGGVDILFNNATGGGLPHSSGSPSSPWDLDETVWESAVAVNLRAPFHLAKMVVPDMKERGNGSIINLLSCAAFLPIAGSIAYGATKAGLHMMTRHLARICAPEVRVNALCPGSIAPDGETLDRFVPHVAKNALPRMGGASEAVGAALFLASDASSYTTGSVMFVEGGRIGTIG